MSSGTTLADRLEAELLPEAGGEAEPQTRSTADRILDAATRRFAADGIPRTTMASIAAEADLSREWLYRHFRNRQAIVTAIIERELRRFIDGLAVRAAAHDDVVESLTLTFVYSVEFLRDHALVPRLVDAPVREWSGDLRRRASAIVGVATRSCTGYLIDLGGFDDESAAVIAETLVRLVGSTVIAPAGGLDLHDPAVLGRYAARIVPAVVRGG